MAPSTACSASGLQGAARSAVSTVEKLSGDTDVIPGWLLPIGVPKEGRGMISNNQRCAAVGMYSAAQIREGSLDLQDRFGRGGAEQDDDFRTDQLDLPLQITPAG